MIDQRSSIRIAGALGAAAMLIFALGHWTDVDLRLADLVYDRAAGAFPWRDAWLTAAFGHGILKAALTALAAGFVLLALADALRPLRWLGRRGRRLRLRITAWSAVLVPLATSLLKQHSDAHCPWDLARYGGSQPYLRLFEALPFGVPPGHCLPGGHASTALWMVALVVWWLPAARRRAALAAALTLGFGFAVGWMQQMRGAHFLTHTLWSMWIACAIVLALVLLMQGRAPARVAPGTLTFAPRRIVPESR